MKIVLHHHILTHREPKTWLPICRRHFQGNYRRQKLLYFGSNIIPEYTIDTTSALVQIMTRPLFQYPITRLLAKSRSREIFMQNCTTLLKFDRHLGSSAADVPAKFQSDVMTTNRAATRRNFKISHYWILKRGPDVKLATSHYLNQWCSRLQIY